MALDILPNGLGAGCRIEVYPNRKWTRLEERLLMVFAVLAAIPVFAFSVGFLVLFPPALTNSAADEGVFFVPWMVAFVVAYNLPRMMRGLGLGTQRPGVVELSWQGESLTLRGAVLGHFDLVHLEWCFDDGLLLRSGKRTIRMQGVILDPGEREQLGRALGVALALARDRYGRRDIPLELTRIVAR